MMARCLSGWLADWATPGLMDALDTNGNSGLRGSRRPPRRSHTLRPVAGQSAIVSVAAMRVGDPPRGLTEK
jgi:hypothetical protein